MLAMLRFSLCARAKAVTVRLTEADSSATVILHVGDRLRIELPTTPAAGYRWSAKKLDASHLETLTKQVRPDSGRLDAAGTQVFVWKAVTPGHVEIGLEYSRPADDRTVAPVKGIGVNVEIVSGELLPTDDGDPYALGPNAVATYRGTLPCDDCLGIAVELTLYNDSPAAGTTHSPEREVVFVERRRYQGAPGGDRTIAGTGKLIVRHGAYADPSMTVYVLAAPDGSTENFRVEGDKLTPLDGQMLPLSSSPGRDVALHRVTKSASEQ